MPKQWDLPPLCCSSRVRLHLVPTHLLLLLAPNSSVDLLRFHCQCICTSQQCLCSRNYIVVLPSLSPAVHTRRYRCTFSNRHPASNLPGRHRTLVLNKYSLILKPRSRAQGHKPMVFRQVCEQPPLSLPHLSVFSQLWPSLASSVPVSRSHEHL